MSEAKHTAGLVHGDGNNIWAEAEDRFSLLIASTYFSDAPVEECEANRERIVLCWNCHDDMLAALKMYVAYRISGLGSSTSKEAQAARREMHDATEAAIAKAEGR